MRYARPVATSLMALFLLSILLAPRSVDAQKAQALPESQWLRYVKARLQFGVHAGHITMNVLRSGGFTSPWSTDRYGRKEQLTIEHNFQSGESSLNYQLLGPESRLTVTAVSNGRVIILVAPGEKGQIVPSEFQQEPSGPLTLSFGKEGEKKTLTSPTIWHLLLAHPDACRQYVLPSLAIFRPDWKLDEQAAALEEELLRAAREAKLPDRRKWAELVAQLGDERFARREAADRQLRAMGRPAVVYLSGLNRKKLDAEQQYRIHRIMESSSDGLQEASSRQVAEAMLGDPTIWLVLMDRDSPSTRALAAQYLGRLLEHPVSFDPEADAATRQKQIERIRKQISGT